MGAYMVRLRLVLLPACVLTVSKGFFVAEVHVIFKPPSHLGNYMMAVSVSAVSTIRHL